MRRSHTISYLLVLMFILAVACAPVAFAQIPDNQPETTPPVDETPTVPPSETVPPPVVVPAPPPPPPPPVPEEPPVVSPPPVVEEPPILIEPEPLPPPTIEPAPGLPPDEAVLGVQEQLPLTGTDMTPILVLGLGLVGTGVVLYRKK